MKKESPSLKLRLRVLPLLKFVDVDDGTFWESGSTGPQVMHCGKGGAQQSWKLKAGDIVVIKEECFEMTRLRRPQRVWHCVVTACADAWLRQSADFGQRVDADWGSASGGAGYMGEALCLFGGASLFFSSLWVYMLQ